MVETPGKGDRNMDCVVFFGAQGSIINVDAHCGENLLPLLHQVGLRPFLHAPPLRSLPGSQVQHQFPCHHTSISTLLSYKLFFTNMCLFSQNFYNVRNYFCLYCCYSFYHSPLAQYNSLQYMLTDLIYLESIYNIIECFLVIVSIY